MNGGSQSRSVILIALKYECIQFLSMEAAGTTVSGTLHAVLLERFLVRVAALRLGDPLGDG
ncbi:MULTISPECIES: hypothetical protein [unclassified Devosia]|jgi:hypothetical protein|uniref:hypothetical protein n=1 Tax=unclassified Devosia TaxID=196773 RepID=UPI0012E35CA6|nr:MULTISPECIES: hypothetical protein [unclassified Devosia]